MTGVTLTFNAQDALSKLWDARTELMRPEPLLRSMVWGGDRLCMDGSSPRKQREALRDKA